MKKRIMNPYLPLYEYIPDGEPRIFGDRLYVYGSHDYAGGDRGFCPGDYMVWSAPLEDLSDWRCDGVGFPRSDCPGLTETDAMAAPDVVRGQDGRYYMYWNTNAQKVCRIAVSDIPEGPFAYYGEVQLSDGTAYEDYKMFDPGVLVDDDGSVYLFVGFCMTGPVPVTFRNLPPMFPKTSLGFRLDRDMKTILEGPVPVIPGGDVSEGTGFEGHAFYEASSPRKVDGKYVMVYSSETKHELAYAVSDEPLGHYRYAGVLISNADIGLNGNCRPVMPFGNNHGGLVEMDGAWYIFYHRQTHGIECCRQGCAQRLKRREDGWFAQAEITSNGLMREALDAKGTYNACYCCHLTAPQIKPVSLTVRENRSGSEPHIYEEPVGTEEAESLHYIANIRGDTTVGYKYFDFAAPREIRLKLRGNGICHGKVRIDSPEGTVIGQFEHSLTGEWTECSVEVAPVTGAHGLYFIFDVADWMNFMEFSFV